MNKNKCVIVRGISGSGKTTFLKKHFPEFATVSADRFFMQDGVYRFDASKLTEAHAESIRNFAYMIQERTPLIAVDNTNLRVAEIAVYAQLATAFDYDVYIFTLLINPVVAAARNVHSVPLDKVAISAYSMEALPPWLGQRQYLLTPDILDFRAREVVFGNQVAG